MTPHLWLQSERDYETGRRLYDALGPNAHLKRTLSTGPSNYNREALAYELGKLMKDGVDTDVPPARVPYVLQPSTPAPHALSLEEIPLVQEPAVVPTLNQHLLDVLQEHVQTLYDKRRHLHAQLELLDEPTRLAYALDIQALSRAIDEHWQTVAYVKGNGHLPPVATAEPVIDVRNGTLADLLSLRANLRSNISKWKKKPARAADLARAQAEEKQLTTRIDGLKREEVRRG